MNEYLEDDVNEYNGEKQKKKSPARNPKQKSQKPRRPNTTNLDTILAATNIIRPHLPGYQHTKVKETLPSA